jgi:PAS domain S-box-containing protein
MGAIGLAIAVGVAYFLAARLSLGLLTKPDGVAVFWPAAGIASGTLIALGAWARVPVTVGVLTASALASLLGDRSIPAAAIFALCNVGEPLLVAWLVKHRFGTDFRLETPTNVLGLFTAAAIAPAISGTIATVGFVLFYNSSAPLLTTWLNWFASDALGIIMVAPLLIGLGSVTRELPRNWELAGGSLTLAALGMGTAIALGSPEQYWHTALPFGMLLPALLAAYCRPVFAAAAALILSFGVVWAATFGVTDPGGPTDLHDRVYAARAMLLAISAGTLLLAALFADRRQREAALGETNGQLKETNRRLQLALDCAELGTWRLDLKSRRFDNDERDRRIHGHGPDAPPQTLAQMRAQVHPDDLSHLDAAFTGLKQDGGHCRAEYRLKACSQRGEDAGCERWVAIEGTVVHDRAGHAVQLLGVTHDITERKHAETRLQEKERELRDLLGALPAAIYVTDAAGRITYCNEAAVNLWGGRPRLGKDRWSDYARYYYADGTPMALHDCPTEIALRQGRSVRGREAVLERPDGTRIPIVPYPTPLRDRTGAVVGVVNMTIDITERKQADQTLAERNAQLALAGQFALVGTFTFDAEAERMQVSPGYVAIHGLPAGTEDISRDYWRSGVHPDDLPGVEAGFQQAMAARMREHYCEYRIVRAGNEIRWIDSRSLISYDRDGAARLVGANIDVTLRKQTEAALAAHKASLADALAAGRVMAFDWNAITGRSNRSANATAIPPIENTERSALTRNDFFKQVHPDDRVRFKATIRALTPNNPTYALTFRFYAPNGEQVWLEETAKGEFDPTGTLLRVKGLTRNITDRKEAELALEERNIQVALAEKAALVGSFAYDSDTEIMQISEGYATIHGFPDGTTEIPRSHCLADVHPDDIRRVQESRSQSFRARRREYNVEYRIARPDGVVRWVETRCFIAYASDGKPQRVLGVSIDITERKHSENHQRALVAELDHRVKNVLATVAAIIAQTQEGQRSHLDFVAALDHRIRSLARTHELLSQNCWAGVSLHDIVQREFAPYASGKLEFDGPHVELRPEAAQAMAMVVHELTTNAAKYGALSNRSGRVRLSWGWLRNGSSGRLAMAWQESGGPPVRAPGRAGYGTTIINELVPYELNGTVALDFAAEGVRCRMEIPPDCISAGRPPDRRPLPSLQPVA